MIENGAKSRARAVLLSIRNGDTIMTYKLLVTSLAIAMAFSSQAFAQDKSQTVEGAETSLPATTMTKKMQTSRTVPVGGVDVTTKAYSDPNEYTLAPAAPDAAKVPVSSEPRNCVTEDGAMDTNCNGVDDAKEPSAIDNRRTIRKRPEPRQQRR